MQFQKRLRPAWSGPEKTGPSFSGAEAIQEGVWPVNWVVEWLKAMRPKLWTGAVSASRIKRAIEEDEMHHWRYPDGRVMLIPFYKPGRVLQEIIELGEYF